MKRSELSWQGQALVPVSGATATAVANQHYVMNNSGASTLTLPAAPRNGTVVKATFTNARIDNIIAVAGGLKIMGFAENMTVNRLKATVMLEYSGATLGWVLV